MKTDLDISKILYPQKCVIHVRAHDQKFEFLQFTSSSAIQSVSFDSIVAWVYFLFDGGRQISEVIREITHRYPEAAPDEINSVIELLKQNRLLNAKADNSQRGGALAPFDCLDVYIENWPPQATRRDSYLVWFLSHIGCKVSLLNSPRDADVIFWIDPTEYQQPFDGKINVLVSAGDLKEKQFSKFDYIINNRPGVRKYLNRWLRFPDCAFEEHTPLENKIHKPLGDGYSIERLSQRFLSMLKQENPRLNAPDINEGKEYLLTIGMATYDDYDGVYFSILSLRLHHAEIMDKCEIIILDNDPNGKAAKHLRNLAAAYNHTRYVPYPDKNSTAVRSVLFELARGKWVVSMDSHVLFPPGALKRFLEYVEAHPDSNDLLQGPLIEDMGKVYASHFNEAWRGGMYGTWDLDERARDVDGEPFEIRMQGLGVFACRKAAWPGFNHLFRGFGGEEGYIHEKIRQRGGRCLCLPFFRWAHRFGRPHGARYALDWKDRIRNYYIGFRELGWDVAPMEEHFRDHLNENVVKEVKCEADVLEGSPFSRFEHIVCINLKHKTENWQAMEKRFDTLGITDRVKRVDALHTPEYHHIGCALTHRQVIQHAKDFGYENVLVFEDDAIMLPGSGIILNFCMDELAEIDWKLFYLGGAEHGVKIELVPGCKHLYSLPEGGLTCTHAIAYHESVYEKLLESLPDNEEDMVGWIQKHVAIDQFLRFIDKRYMTSPKLFSQRGLLGDEDPRYRALYD